VVFEDAENLDHVAEHVVNAAFWNAGQNCSATSRLIVHNSLKAELVGKIEARLRDWKMGDPLDPANHIGALIDEGHCAKVRGFLKDKGKGPFVAPVVVEVSADDPRAREEIFGPVLSVIGVASNDEAVQVANDTSYGLTASVFSAGGRSATFGGYKQSGFGGRDNGLHAHDQYTEVKTIWIDLVDPADGDNVG